MGGKPPMEQNDSKSQVDDSATFFESLSWGLEVICTFGLKHEHIRLSRRGSGPRSSLMAGQWLMDQSSCSRPVRAECKARSSPDTFPPAEEASSLGQLNTSQAFVVYGMMPKRLRLVRSFLSQVFAASAEGGHNRAGFL